jgi:uncharacterized protein YdhG (YjbR/CyaY superfamily)
MATTRTDPVGAYIASKPKDARAALTQVREAIRKAVPGAQESIAYKMPVYTLDGVFVLYFAGWKAHYSLYPVTDDIAAAFARELAPYERTKGGVRLPYSEPVPARLIGRIAKFRATQLAKRDAGRTGRTAQLARVRRLCRSLPSVSEKMSHGTPTFFVTDGKGVFAMFSDHHHEDGRLALWVPVPDGQQTLMISEAPEIYFKPPYVGASGWIGIDLAQIRDDALGSHLQEAWRLIARKMPASRSRPAARPARRRARRASRT